VSGQGGQGEVLSGQGGQGEVLCLYRVVVRVGSCGDGVLNTLFEDKCTCENTFFPQTSAQRSNHRSILPVLHDRDVVSSVKRFRRHAAVRDVIVPRVKKQQHWLLVLQ